MPNHTGPFIGIIDRDAGALLILEMRDSLQRQIYNDEQFGGY